MSSPPGPCHGRTPGGRDLLEVVRCPAGQPADARLGPDLRHGLPDRGGDPLAQRRVVEDRQRFETGGDLTGGSLGIDQWYLNFGRRAPKNAAG